MAYKTKELIGKALKVIPEKKIIFIEELASFMHIDKGTIYAHKIHENNEVKNLIEQQRDLIKKSLQSKMHNSDSPAAWSMLYKLTGRKEERDALNQSNIDHTTNGKDIPSSQVIVLTESEKENYLKEIEKIEE